MAPPKRKRVSDVSNSAAPANGLASPVSSQDVPEHFAEDFCPFQVQVLKNPANPPKRRKKEDDWTEVKTEDFEEADKTVSYIISPAGPWEAMKKYKNFVVQDMSFGTNDYVFINNNGGVENLEEEGRLWVGRVLEIRAKSASQVYLRITWMYWPSELPVGRQSYHGAKELVASNYLQIIDAMTVADRADVVHVIESDENSPPAEALYWRQKYNFLSNKLSPLKRECTCKEYHNPDKLLIICNKCDRWQHETCIVRGTLRKCWEQIQKSANDEVSVDGTESASGSGNKGLVAGTIKLAQNFGNAVKSRSNDLGPKSNSNNEGKKIKGKGKSRSSMHHVSEAWEGILDGRLDRVPDKQGEETAEITGKVSITDSRGDPTTQVYNAECLFCHELLVPAQEAGPSTAAATPDEST